MKKTIISAALSSLVLASFSTFANDVILGVEKNNTSTSTSFELAIPVSEGMVNWDGLVGMGSTTTNHGAKMTKNINGENVTVETMGGSANYLIIGVQGRKYIIDNFVEAVVKADYDFRSGGTTEYHEYSMATGKVYDPKGKLNIGVGANMVLRNNIILGATVERNVESGESTVKLKLGARF